MADDEKAGPSAKKLSRRTFLKHAGAGAAAAAVGALYRPGGADAGGGDAQATIAQADVAERLGPGPINLELKINGVARTAQVEPRLTLLEFLRDRIGLTGAKLVCDRGACGACTVHLDGNPINACMMLAADARGHEITTIEGIGTPAQMHPVQAAFVEFDALQCGFCTPGMIMAIVAALKRNPHPSVDQIKRAVAGNICRCGTYPHVFEAAMAAARTAGRPPRSGSI